MARLINVVSVQKNEMEWSCYFVTMPKFNTEGKGLEFYFSDNPYPLNLDFKGQFLVTTPNEGFPDKYKDFTTREPIKKINCTRIKF